MRLKKLAWLPACVLAVCSLASLTGCGGGTTSYENTSDGIVGDNDYDGDVDEDDWEEEAGNYLDSMLDAYDDYGE